MAIQGHENIIIIITIFYFIFYQFLLFFFYITTSVFHCAYDVSVIVAAQEANKDIIYNGSRLNFDAMCHSFADITVSFQFSELQFAEFQL